MIVFNSLKGCHIEQGVVLDSIASDQNKNQWITGTRQELQARHDKELPDSTIISQWNRLPYVEVSSPSQQRLDSYLRYVLVDPALSRGLDGVPSNSMGL